MKIRIAAVHMNSILGDVKVNMETVYGYIKQAKEKGAELIVLPEFFTTGFAFSDKILKAVAENDNPQNKLIEWAKKFNIIIGGSFLNFNGTNALNTFSLTFPNGSAYFHSKDIATGIENFCYTNGDENNVLYTPIGNIGVSNCFEFIRYNTVRRMNGKVDFVIGGSCWWSFNTNNKKCIEANKLSNEIATSAPVNLSKILKVPVVHASYNADFFGKNFFIDGEMQRSTILGATQIIDKDSNIILSRNYDESSKVLVSDMEYSTKDRKYMDINKEKFWIPDLPQVFIDRYNKMNEKYSKYYEKISKPYYMKNII